MTCPKCKQAMARCYAGFSCRCGMWVESPPEPEMTLTREQWDRRATSKHVGTPLGTVRSDAADLAVKFFDSISDLLCQGASWRGIGILVKAAAATEVRFDVKSLQKYYLLEQNKRGGMTV